MQRLLILFIFTISFSFSSAQIQNGKVRTPGRNGKPGVGIENVLIRVKGSHNDEPSGKNGVFSLQLGDVRMGDGFQIASIRKVGYEIFDKNLRFPSTFPYSNVPIDIVMIKSEDLAREKQAWIDKGYSNAEKLYSERLKDLKNRYTEEKERNEHLKDLKEWYEKYQGLIEGMADYYVHVDYDRLDEGLRQITNAIQEGEYLLADSLINVYAPNLEEDVKNSIKAHEKIREQKEYGESIVAKAVSDSIEQAKKDEKTSSFLFAKYTTSVNANKWDDALHYLKLRADLDTTNVSAVRQYAILCYQQKKFTDCERYLHICLSIYLQNSDAYQAELADAQNNLGNLYYYFHDFQNSEKNYKLSLENYEQLFYQKPEDYRAALAMTQGNLGNLYRFFQNYCNGEKYIKLALENYEQLFRHNPDAYRADLAMTQNNLGILYGSIKDYANCEKYYKLALDNYEQLFLQNPDTYCAHVAIAQNNLGCLYYDREDYSNSEKYHKLALEKREYLFAQNPDAYRTYLAFSQNNLGQLYCELHDYENSEKYLKLALRNREQLFDQNSEANRADLANTQNNLGLLYLTLQDFQNSEKYYKLEVENREELFHQNPDAYKADLAMTYCNMMLLYREMKNLEQYNLYLNNALKMYKELYSSQPTIYVYDVIGLQLANGIIDEAFNLAQETYNLDESNEMSKNYLAECYNMKAFEYAKASEFDNAHAAIDKAISLVPENANFYDSKGEILLMQGKNDEALKMWKKVMELNPQYLDGYPDGTNLSNELKKLGLIE